MKIKHFILCVIVLGLNILLLINDFWGQTKVASVVSNVDSALKYLHLTHDKYHKTFDVYTDQDAGGNHFTPSGWMCQNGYNPEDQIEFKGDWLKNPYSGTTCIRIKHTYSKGHAPWAGIYWLYPDTNWAKIPNAGYNLTGADSLVFYAKGENGNEIVEFFAFGVGRQVYAPYNPTEPYPDSSPRVPRLFQGYRQLTTDWERYIIDLNGIDLSYVIGGFCFTIAASNNGNKDIIFYLDDIQFYLNDITKQKRMEEPRLLLSYSASLDTTDYVKDKSLRNSANTEDNAKVMLALMDTANIYSDDWKRAKIIGDALIICQNNDRYFNSGRYDGRLRNGYQAGDLLDNYTQKSRLPGWFDNKEKKWLEVEYAAGTYTGNMAWVIIAWLHYHKFKPEQAYLDAAINLGNWILKRYDSNHGGYKGGFAGFDSIQTEIEWKSIEHNILIYNALTLLYQETGDSVWFEGAMGAREWAENKWNSILKRFQDTQTNVHAIAYLFLRDFYEPGIEWVENNCLVDTCSFCDQFTGFDYNNDCDGIWLEGTALMCLGYYKSGEAIKAQKYLLEIEKMQTSARNANNMGIVEACHDSLTTGQIESKGVAVFKTNRLHIGATSLYIMAKLKYHTAIKTRLEGKLPVTYSLNQNFPNPFNDETTLYYNLPKTSKVTLKIFNSLGRELITLDDSKKAPGGYSITWDGKDSFNMGVPSGVYFYRIIANNFVETKKMLLIR